MHGRVSGWAWPFVEHEDEDQAPINVTPGRLGHRGHRQIPPPRDGAWETKMRHEASVHGRMVVKCVLVGLGLYLLATQTPWLPSGVHWVAWWGAVIVWVTAAMRLQKFVAARLLQNADLDALADLKER